MPATQATLAPVKCVSPCIQVKEARSRSCQAHARRTASQVHHPKQSTEGGICFCERCLAVPESRAACVTARWMSSYGSKPAATSSAPAAWQELGRGCVRLEYSLFPMLPVGPHLATWQRRLSRCSGACAGHVKKPQAHQGTCLSARWSRRSPCAAQPPRYPACSQGKGCSSVSPRSPVPCLWEKNLHARTPQLAAPHRTSYHPATHLGLHPRVARPTTQLPHLSGRSVPRNRPPSMSGSSSA